MYKIYSSTNLDEKSTIKNLQQDILFLYEILDKKVEDILENINSSVYDYRSAMVAKNIYDKNWFCDLLASVESKIKIATLLKNLCAKYQITSLTWDAIVDNSSSTLEQIDILQNKNKFRKNFEG